MLMALLLVVTPLAALNVLNPGEAEAHISPPDGSVATVAIGLSAYKMPGELFIPPAMVTQGDVVKYKVTLSFGALPPGGVGYDFQSGQVKVTLPNSTVVEVAGFGGSTPDVPLITASTPWTVDVPTLYTVDLADRVGGLLIAYAAYGVGVGVHPENGYFHNEAGDPAMVHPRTASATTANQIEPTTGNLIIYKYNDLDGNGSWDVGEPYLSGWHFDVTGPQTFMDQVTDGTGKITLSDIAIGNYTITEHTPLPAGWVNTDPPGSPPLTKPATVNAGATTEVWFGNYQTATKSGIKFNDLDADGVKDAGEPGLGGWTIYVDYDNDGILDAGEPSAVTAAVTGAYTITGIVPGTWRVKEEAQAGWTCSYPALGYHEETFTSGATLLENDFGNWTTATKTGMKFNDLDADGVKDAGEPGLVGWTIYVDYDNDGVLDAGEPFAVTAADGSYTITGIVPGTWKTREVAQAGWTNSFPATSDAFGCYHEDTFTSGEAEIGNDFGNWQPATKSGMKFNDLDADGAKDVGEPGLPGWTIYVDYDNDGVLDAGEPSAVTAADGTYTITGIVPGTWKTREVAQAGWTNSFPAISDAFGRYHQDTFTSGEAEIGNDFGNWQPATKSGMKFNDLDADGVKDVGEPGLPGWTIYVDYDNDGVKDVGEPSAVTAADGTYTITGINPGTWKTREVAQVGWTNSFPATSDAFGRYHEDTFTSGEAEIGNDFGNWQPGTLIIFKFNDLDGDGIQDAGELPLSGWAFSVTGGPSPTPGPYSTNASGLITIPNLIPGDYAVTETVQADWQCTTLNPQLGTVPAGGSAQVNFGNRYAKRTLRIYKFNDLNGNGVPDFDEGGLGGWEFTIDPGIGKRITGSDGWIIINITLTDTNVYTVTETLKSGWLTTTPNPQYADMGIHDEVTLYFGNVEQVEHPPLVPVIGTWGTGLLAVAFAGALIWVVALRRRRQTDIAGQ
jgi:hypothetical protein